MPMEESKETTDSAGVAPAIRMKKVRKRSQFKSSLTPLEDEAADAQAAEEHLHAIKAIQDLRSKKSGALTLGETGLHLPDREMSQAAAATANAGESMTLAAAPSLGKEFGAQGLDSKDAQQMLIHEQMEKYIAQQLEARRALRQPQAPPASAAPAAHLSDASLFVTPSHLALSTSSFDAAEAGERWLTGISEVPLSVQDRMKNIEATEKAKRRLAEVEQARLAKQTSLILPANYNSNFKLHKKEWEAARVEEWKQFNDAQERSQAAAHGIPLPAPSSTGPRPPSLLSQVSALPAYLAGGDSERREQNAERRKMVGGGGTQQGGQQHQAVGTDDKIVGRFLKKMKNK